MQTTFSRYERNVEIEISMNEIESCGTKTAHRGDKHLISFLDMENWRTVGRTIFPRKMSNYQKSFLIFVKNLLLRFLKSLTVNRENFPSRKIVSTFHNFDEPPPTNSFPPPTVHFQKLSLAKKSNIVPKLLTTQNKHIQQMRTH